MSESLPFLEEQLAGIEPSAPNYEYEGLELPQGLVVDGYFGSHANIDVAESKAHLRQADFVIMENAGWDEATLKVMQKVAAGNYAAREKMLRTIQLQDGGVSDSQQLGLGLKAIYDIRRPLLVIDPPFNHRSIKATHKHFQTPNAFSPDFSEAIAQTRTRFLEYGQVVLDRENYMLRSFCEQFTERSVRDDKFAAKLKSDEGVKVTLFNFGLVHSGIYLGLQEVARRSNVVLPGEVHFDSSSAVLLDYKSQAYGRYMRGQEIDDTLCAKHVVSSVLAYQRLRESGGTPGTQDQIDITRQVLKEIEAMSLEELAALYSEIAAP